LLVWDRHVILNPIQVSPFAPPSVSAIALPLIHIGSVNAWLLRGDPLTLVDAGPANDEALEALRAGLRDEGVRVEDIELVLGTHHHLDHVGLAPAVREASGAEIVLLGEAADYVADAHEHIERDRAYSYRLMAAHGVPDDVIADNEPFWDFLRANSSTFEPDARVADGDTIRAGGRDLHVLARPGHSRSDTLFVDHEAGEAFVGDHLLAGISSNTEIAPPGTAEGERPRPRTEYLRNLARTARMPVDVLYAGHGRPVRAHRALVDVRVAEHRTRAARIAGALLHRPESAYGIAKRLWSERTVRQQPLLVVWEVLGHLELLVTAGLAYESREDGGHPRFALTSRADPRPRRSHAGIR
jgi:glyoxylase-like metal-dependent hydrolase (beta-lactamase superfamily II)